jgi:hypothetical protein
MNGQTSNGKYPFEVPISGFLEGQSYPRECVTLIKAYAHECFNSKFTQTGQRFGNGKEVWSVNAVSEYCTQIAAARISESGGYKAGDIISCNGSSAAGHVVIALNNANSASSLKFIHQSNNMRPKIQTGLTREVYGLLRPNENLGNYTNTNIGNVNSETIKISYTTWKGYGIIKKDYTRLYWYLNGETTPSPWNFYGMAKERMDFLGKVGNYYYGWVNGICQSRILCLVPTEYVNNITGSSTGRTSSFEIGANYKN